MNDKIKHIAAGILAAQSLAIGQQRIGDYIARMLLGNDSHF